MEEKTNGKIHPIGIESQLLIKRLLKVEPGQTITYQELTKEIGLDVRSAKGRSYLQTAKNRVEVDHKISFDTVWTVGFKRRESIQDFEKVGEKSLKRSTRIARKAIQSMQCLNQDEYEKATSAEKTKINTLRTIHTIIKETSKKSNQKQIESKVSIQNGQLPYMKGLDALRGKDT